MTALKIDIVFLLLLFVLLAVAAALYWWSPAWVQQLMLFYGAVWMGYLTENAGECGWSKKSEA